IGWAQIVALHDVLGRIDPSPVSRLARAIAVAGRDGPAAGLELVEGLLAEGELDDYLPIHAARADLCRRLARPEDALTSYRRALALARQQPEQRYFRKKIAELDGLGSDESIAPPVKP